MVTRCIQPREMENRWNLFWEQRRQLLSDHGVLLVITRTSASLQLGVHVIAQFSYGDIPADIDHKLVELLTKEGN